MSDQTITPVTADRLEQTQTRLTIEPMIQAADGSEWAFNGTGYDDVVMPGYSSKDADAYRQAALAGRKVL